MQTLFCSNLFAGGGMEMTRGVEKGHAIPRKRRVRFDGRIYE